MAMIGVPHLMRNVRDGIVFSVEQFSRSGHSLLGNILMNCGIELLAKTLFKRGFIGAYSACELSNRWGSVYSLSRISIARSRCVLPSFCG